MTFWLSNRLVKQRTVLTRPTRQLLHPPALSLPRQPLCPRTRLVPCTAAMNYRFLRGGWDDPNCARPPTTVSPCGVREHKACPSYSAPCFSSRQVVTC